MTTVFTRALEAIRVWLGLNDPDRLHASHGWLLPTAAQVRALAFDRALAMAPARMAPVVRGRRR